MNKQICKNWRKYEEYAGNSYKIQLCKPIKTFVCV